MLASSEVIGLVTHAGPMVWFVLFLLFIFSVACWAIVFIKSYQQRLARKESEIFIDLFWRGGELSKAFASAKQLKHSPVARVFRVAYTEMSRVNKSRSSDPDITNDGVGETNPFSSMGIGNIERALGRATNSEFIRLMRLVPFLATVGNTAPFIGLFGTVWGIMNSFHQIGQTGSATLAIVAPGISEALVATAAGLATAIPAVIAYNHFINRIRMTEYEIRSFASDFINTLEREMRRKK